ncbi:hypothetical protein QTP70_032921, partial [Hemibagrus guttatus]
DIWFVHVQRRLKWTGRQTGRLNRLGQKFAVVTLREMGPPAAESVPADHPAAKPVAAASSMLDPIVTVPPVVETGLGGGNPGATVAKPMGDKAGTSDPAKSDKEMREPTSEPPVQISQVKELESSLDVDFKDNGDSDAEMEAEPVLSPLSDRYVTRTGVTGAPPWSQAWGWGTQASTWWPSLCLRDSAGHSPKKRRRPTFP